MRGALLDEWIFVEKEAHVGNDDLVYVGQQVVGRVVSELSMSEGVETADPANESWLFSEFVVDEGGDGSQGNKPSSLDVVHLLE